MKSRGDERDINRSVDVEPGMKSVTALGEGFDARSVVADEIDDDTFFEIECPEGITKLFRAGNRVAIDGCDDVALLDAGACGRAIFLNASDDDAICQFHL